MTVRPAAVRPTGRWRPRNVPVPEQYLLGLAVGAVADRLHPWRLPGPRSVHRVVGILLVAAGGGFALRAVRAAGPVDLAAPDRLVRSGPYAVSRNPMYAGWALMQVGYRATVPRYLPHPGPQHRLRCQPGARWAA